MPYFETSGCETCSRRPRKITFFEWSPPSDVLSDTNADILSGILSGIYSNSLTFSVWHSVWQSLTCCLASILALFGPMHAQLHPDLLIGLGSILSQAAAFGTCGGREERRGEERPAPLLKSRDRRLADAEKTMNQVAGWAVCQPIAAMPPPIRPVRSNIESANFYAFSFANQETKPAHFKPHISLVSGGSKWGNLKPLHPTPESGSLSANCNLQQYGAVEIGWAALPTVPTA